MELGIVPSRDERLAVLAVCGVHLRGAVGVTDVLGFVNLAELPRTDIGQRLQNPRVDDLLLTQARTRSAIVHRIKVTDNAFSYVETMEDLAFCISIITRQPAIPFILWCQWQDVSNVTQEAIQGGFGVQRFFEVQVEGVEYDPARIKDLYQLYTAISNPKLVRRLRLAMRRLSSVNPTVLNDDRAIDLGIALEALLMRGHESNVSHKFRVRGSLLRGGDPSTHDETYNLLKDFYDIRSRVAHGDASYNTDNDREEIIDKVLNLSFDLCAKLIEFGGQPDWDVLAASSGWEVPDLE